MTGPESPRTSETPNTERAVAVMVRNVQLGARSFNYLAQRACAALGQDIIPHLQRVYAIALTRKEIAIHVAHMTPLSEVNKLSMLQLRKCAIPAAKGVTPSSPTIISPGNRQNRVNDEQISATIRLGVLYVEAGSRRFSDWAKSMCRGLGNRADEVKPHLARIYAAVYRRPEIKRYHAEMDTPAQARKASIDDLLVGESPAVKPFAKLVETAATERTCRRTMSHNASVNASDGSFVQRDSELPMPFAPPTPADFGLSSEDAMMSIAKWRAQRTRTLLVAAIIVAMVLYGLFEDIAQTNFLILGIGFLTASAVSIAVINRIVERYWPPLRRLARYEIAKSQHGEAVAKHRAEQLRKQREFWLELSGHAFESELASLLIRVGLSCQLTRATGDEGVDIWINHDGYQIPLQCKRHNSPVGVGAIRDLLGAMTHARASTGILASVSGFTRGAKGFADSNRIVTIDLDQIMEIQSNRNASLLFSYCSKL